MKRPLQILLLEDNAVDAELLQGLLEQDGFALEIKRVDTKAEFQRALEEEVFDLIISDFTLPAFDGMTALTMAQEKKPDLPFLFFSGTIGEEAAVESLKNGATDYVLKHRTDKLGAAVRRALREVEDRRMLRQTEHTLRQRERWFRALTENSLDIVTILNAEGAIKYNSPSLERVLGFLPEELAGRSSFEFIHPEDVGAAQEALASSILHPDQAVRLDFRFRHKQGGWRYLEAIGQNLLNDAEIAGVVINSRDMTERRLAEERYRLIFDNAVEGICQTTPEGRFVTNNPSLAAMLGYASPQDLMASVSDVGRQIYARPEERAELTRRIAQDGIVKGFEMQALRKDGSRIWISINSQPIRDSSGAVVFFESTIEDITERRLAHEQIQQQAALLDAANDAIFLADMEGHILYWNQGAERLYGWTHQEVAGKNPSVLFCQSKVFQLPEFQNALSGEGRWEGELKQVKKDGQEIVVGSRWTLLREDDGNPKSVLVINTDITEKKKAEAQYLRAQRMECLGALAGGIAHDLNNVLAPTLMVADLLLGQAPSPDAKEMLSTVKASAERGAEMIKQILSFARGVGGGPVPLELKHLIHEVAKLLKQTFPPSIEIQTAIAPGLQQVLGQATQLHQVLMNLGVNARDAMAQGGVLRIEATPTVLANKRVPVLSEPVSGPYVLLAVSDTGTGIPAHLLDRIFEPFFTTKAEGLGTGLGLPTVLGIVRNHGGFVEVRSEVGRGTTFQVYLPAIPKPDSTLDSPPPAPPPAGRGQLVLVVDDEVALLELSKVMLENYGYRVLTAGNGLEGYELYQRYRGEIKVLVTDLLMPIMDGVALIKRLRSLDPEFKVVCVSGIDSRAKLPEAERLVVQGFVAKPYTTNRLLNILAAVLNPHSKE